MLAGPPCAGKSSVGRLLATSSLHGPYIEIDALFSLLLPGSDRNRHDRMLAYDAAHAIGRTVFERGMTPILECTYSRHEQRASLLQAVPAAPLRVVEFFVSPDDAVQRFRRRREGTADRITTWLRNQPGSVRPDLWAEAGKDWQKSCPDPPAGRTVGETSPEGEL